MKRIGIGVALATAVAGVAYLATLGCCHLVGFGGRQAPLAEQLHLSLAQRRAIASLEKTFLAEKQASCGRLCEKRAQLIQLLRQPEPDRATLDVLVKEIGQEQASLEKATLNHLLAMRRYLEPPQLEKLNSLMTEQLRTACKLTACGSTPGCSISEKSN